MWKTQAGWFEAWFDHPAYPVLYAHRDQTEADAWVDTLVHKVFRAQDAAGPVLDCGCGHGRHARRLADHGIPTVGVDLSAQRIAEASSHPQPHLTFVRGDARDLSTLFPQNHFSAVLSLFTSFGYLETSEADAGVLHEMHAVLQQGGLLLLDYLNVHRVRSEWVPHERIERSDTAGTPWTFEIRRFEERGGFIKSITVRCEGTEVGHFEEFVRAYTSEDLGNLLRNGGFAVMHAWGDYALSPFSPAASRCIIAAEKR